MNSFVESELEKIYIPTRGDFACMGAAAYLAMLAYPMEYAKRDKFIEAVKASLFKGWRDAAPDAAERTRRRKEIGPTYTAFKNEHLLGIFNATFARILKRLRPAREIAENFGLRFGIVETANAFARHSPRAASERSIKTVDLNIEIKFPFGAAEWSAAFEVGDRMYEEQIRKRPDATRFPRDPCNVVRIFRESKPVLHLAMALPLDHDDKNHPVFDQRVLWKRICKPDWLEKSLDRAEFHRCTSLPMFYAKYDPRRSICVLPESCLTAKLPSKI